jgi:hypothetical protein
MYNKSLFGILTMNKKILKIHKVFEYSNLEHKNFSKKLKDIKIAYLKSGVMCSC